METHVTKVRVTYADTDHAGAVYYANYLRWMEIARTEILRKRGITYAAYEKEGLVAPVVHCEIDYFAAPLYDDIVDIHTAIEKVGNTSLVFSYEFRKGEQLLAKGSTVNVFINAKREKQPVPEAIRKLSPHPAPQP